MALSPHRERPEGVIQVAIACNNQRGNFDGRVGAANFQDRRGYHVTLYGPEVRATYLEDRSRIRISRRVFDIAGWRFGVGNWCWDGFQMTRGQAMQLVAYLFKRGWDAEEWSTDGPFAKVVDAHRSDSAQNHSRPPSEQQERR